MFSDNRNKVVNSRIEGNDESATAFGMYIVTISNKRLIAMFTARRVSIKKVGNGTIIKLMIATNNKAIDRSLERKAKFFMQRHPTRTQCRSGYC